MFDIIQIELLKQINIKVAETKKKYLLEKAL